MSNDHQDRPQTPESDERTADSAVPATQQLPSGEVPATQQLPASAPGDPLAVFDEPIRSASSAPEPAAAEDPVAASTTSAASVDDSPAVPARPLVRSGPRITTIVWGFIVVAIGVGLLASTAGASIDLELAAILLLAVAGLMLVVGSVAGSLRRRRQATVS
ncbi:hypothetical protein GCM10009718_07390 [Isoptericola halotolerans]|uniref:Uncharacterized protein n=1 Tax=Isoptericola halotolerans TaxID=300560 RepID=A0ABX2A0I1_9MICO|nr:hypothetical protein [Isoptericola halotolerans]NOV96338.1 hypothetical protein [Isoptericola halotolerans]